MSSTRPLHHFARSSLRLISFSLVLGLGLLIAPSAQAVPPGADRDAFVAAQRALFELRLSEVEAEVNRLYAEYPNDGDVLLLRASLLFHNGHYPAAKATLAPLGESAGEFGETVRATADTVEAFASRTSEDGRFIVRYSQPDEVLADLALDALARIDRAMTELFGAPTPGPIRLELYPSPATLAAVSSLTVENIERTGTIALCKWNRLMVTSPRALVRGYPWMDTIAHEYVHLALAHATRDRAPVWLQEGIAKFFERRWRDPTPRAPLEPRAEGLLKAALQSDELIDFERLHPSIALLPSQEDASLAFAQVATFIERYHAEGGDARIRELVRMVQSGRDARQAVGDAAGSSFADIERDWKAWLPERVRDAEVTPALPMRFRRGEEDSDLSEVAEAARRHVRLGDLLWDRQHFRAASVQYGRAREAAPSDPIAACRFAQAALAGDRPAEAAVALESVLEAHPEHAPALALLSEAAKASGDASRAEVAARAALRVNPFDPRPHCVLGEVSSDEREQLARRGACERLQSR